METKDKLTIQEAGFLNRHVDGLPSKKCIIKIINKDVDGAHYYLCDWTPYIPSQHGPVQPSKGYLGTAKVIEGQYKGIGFHAWEQNNSEFVHYVIVK